MKKVFTFLAVSFTVATGSLFAQVNPMVRIQKSSAISFTEKKAKILSSNPSFKSTELKPSAFTLPCGVVPDSLKMYTATIEVSGQEVDVFLTGTNPFGDEAFGQIFSTGITTTVTSVQAYLLKAYDGGSAVDINAKIYAVSNGLPTTLLGTSQPVSPADITAEGIAPVTFSFASPVTNVPSTFAVVITVPEYANESAIIVILSSSQGCFAQGQENKAISYSELEEGWDWTSINDAWEIPAILGFDLAIFPTVNETVGINSVENDNQQVSIFPNPATDKVYIENAAGSTIRIYDVAGKLLVEKKAQNAKEEIGVKQLNPGMYFIEMQSKTGKTTQKLIKK